MFELLENKLSNVFKTLKGHGKIREGNIQDALLEVKKSLLEADVHYRVVQSIVDQVKNKVLGDNVLEGVDPSDQFIKAVHDELVRVLGENSASMPRPKNGPLKILLMGLQGSGKTTTAAKLALYFKNKEMKIPLLVPCDLQRLAAVTQLKTLASTQGLKVYESDQSTALGVVKACQASIEQREVNAQVVIYDTAGRLAIDDDLVKELVDVQRAVDPDLTLYVLDAMAGQSALGVAQDFSKHVKIDGVIATKTDGDARGGAILSLQSFLKAPVYFLGVSEKMDGLDVFHPTRMASRILGMGDIVSLVEKAKEVFDQKNATEMAKKMIKNQFTIEDFMTQMEQISKMGSMEDLIKYLPGATGLKQALAGGLPESEMNRTQAIVRSMTIRERRNYKIIDGSRRLRIANGSGTSVMEVNRFLKQFIQTQKMMGQMGKPGFLKGGFPRFF